MKRNVGLLLFALLTVGGCAANEPASGRPAAAAVAPAITQKQVFVIRHLQKAQGDDPPLTAQGAANAQRLAELLAGKGIVAIFATPTRRAMQTAAPLAARVGVAITPYNPKDPQALAKAVEATAGSVLVVGHSNTVPDLVDRLGGPPQQPMGEEDYGILFILRPDGRVETLTVR